MSEEHHDSILTSLARFAEKSKLLSLLDMPGIVKLAHIGHEVRFVPGEVVVRQGDIGSTFYLIVSGELRVSVDEAGEVARLRSGQFFGEMGVMTRQPRSATVEAIVEAELVEFQRDPVMEILVAYPRVKEVLGSVGLQRSEENLQKLLDDGDDELGLADLLEGDDEDLPQNVAGPGSAAVTGADSQTDEDPSS